MQQSGHATLKWSRAALIFVLACSPSAVTAPTPRGQGEAAQAQRHEAPRASYAWSHAGPALVAMSARSRFQLDAGGFHLRPAQGDWALSLSLRALGRADDLRRLPSTSATRDARPNEARAHHSGVTERWINGPEGVEQVFEIAERPSGAGPLLVELDVAGMRAKRRGAEVVFVDARGAARARYGHLHVEDAFRRTIPAQLEVSDDGAHVRIVVADAEAHYPLVIDPLLATLETVLTAPGEPVPSGLGQSVAGIGGSVAVSADGAWALVSAAKTAVFQRAGAVWKLTTWLPAVGGVAIADDASRAAVGGAMFVRSGSTWTQEAALSAVRGVVLTPDGTRALVYDRNGASAPAIHLRTGTSWALEGTLTVPGLVAADRFGPAALSADGTRALVGAPGYDTRRGRAWVFARGASGWSIETELSGSGIDEVEFGTSVSLSADGSRALVGEPLQIETTRTTLPCSVFVFNRTGTSWTSETAITQNSCETLFGYSVALSRDGSRAAIGAPNFRTSQIWRSGAVHFYARASNGTWTPETQFGERGHDWLGTAVALTPDATRAIVGNVEDDSISGPDTGSARSYVRSGSSWSEEGDLGADGPSTGDHFGSAVAISDGGDRIVVGAPAAPTALHADGGRALSFVRSGVGWVYERHFPASGRPALADQTWDQTAPDRKRGAMFGAAVAVSAQGDRVLVGEPADDESDGGSLTEGAVRVFVRGSSEWIEEALLTVSASEWPGGNAAGASVAITADGTRALVGAYGKNLWDAAVSMYVRASGGWTEEASLTLGADNLHNGLGHFVALSDDGTHALASVDYDARSAEPLTNGPPSVIVYARSGSSWTEETTLSASAFVSGLALNHDATIAAVAHRDGSIRVFSRTGAAWSDAGLVRPATTGRFDVSIAMSSDGKRVLAGLPNDDTTAGAGAGSARLYVNSGSTWSEVATLLAPSAAAGDHFGVTVAMTRDGRHAVIGASDSDTPVADAGSVTVFTLISHCATHEDCTSGYCVDGVCCDGPCGGGVADCQACSVASGGTADGFCTPLSVSAAGQMQCRAAAGVCDVAEHCSVASIACPADQLAAAGAVCRAAVDACDVAEQCDGVSMQCPQDVEAECGAPGVDGGQTTDPDPVDAGLPTQDDAGSETDAAGVSDGEDAAIADGGDGSDAAVTASDDAMVASTDDGPDAEPSDGDADAATEESEEEPEGCAVGARRGTPSSAFFMAMIAALVTRGRRRRRTS